MIDYAHEIKQTVTMRQVCERYGIEVNRANTACCPFHSDRSPSMHVYDGDRGYWCYACNSGGDVIDFTMRYFKIPFKNALERLNEDFSLNLPLNAPLDRKARQTIARRKQLADTQRSFDAWRFNTIKHLAECFRLAHLSKKMCSSAYWTQPMIDAVKEQARIEDWLDTLDGDDLERQVQIFRQRKEVNAVCEKILNPLQMN